MHIHTGTLAEWAHCRIAAAYASDAHALSCSSTTRTHSPSSIRPLKAQGPRMKNAPPCSANVSPTARARALDADWTPRNRSMACLTTTPLTRREAQMELTTEKRMLTGHTQGPPPLTTRRLKQRLHCTFQEYLKGSLCPLRSLGPQNQDHRTLKLRTI